MKTINPTNTTIDIQVVAGYKIIEVPVMRNGKPTKRTKSEYVNEYATIKAQGYEIDGHIVYIPKIDMTNGGCSNYLKGLARVYRENGERLTGSCVFGHTGKVEHERGIFFSLNDNELCMAGTGYDGPCGKGHTIYMGKINW